MSFRLAPLLAALAVASAGAFAQAPADEEPVYVHQAVRGDTLIGLGRRFLVDPKRWPEVQRANDIRNPNRIPVGSAVRIPLRLMRTEAASATVLGVTGEVRTAGQAVAAGQPVGEGGGVHDVPSGQEQPGHQQTNPVSRRRSHPLNEHNFC